MSLLSIKNLIVSVGQLRAERIVDDLAMEIPVASICGLVGGSGSGKTTTGYSIMGLLDPALNIQAGEILFKGGNLLKATPAELRTIRGGQISMIFQEPLNAFNPVFSIGYQIDEMLQFHSNFNKSQRNERILEVLDLVGMPDPKRIVKNYPHQLSGGMRQRAMIAQAIVTNPELVIADEPTSSLDVTLQARIVELFKKINDELNISFLLITHDLGMVEHLCSQVSVMHKGKIVEAGQSQEILNNPKHDYTQMLLEALRVQ